MTKKLEDYFKEFEDKVASIEGNIVHNNGPVWTFDSPRTRILKHFRLIKRFIVAQQDLENQRDLWLTTVDLLNDSKAFNDEVKEKMREELLADCFEELKNLNNTIHLQLANKPDTTVKGNAKKANKPDAKFNWQGSQTELVYLIEKLYEQGFLSPISQPEKHWLTAQHFTVKGKNLNQKNLAKARDNNLKTKKGKPKRGEEIEQIISAAKNQNPSKT
jgi:hypothetical protein